MPMSLSDNEVWERIRGFLGREFNMIERKELTRKVVRVDTGSALIEKLESGRRTPLLRQHVIKLYKWVKQKGEYTRDHRYELQSKGVPIAKIALIIALLAVAVPEEIVAFTRAHSPKGLRGIRKKDC